MKNSFFKRFNLVVLFFVATFFHSALYAQRIMEKLDRGVVAVKNSSNGYLISWRYLTSDPEDIQFNVYAKKSNESSFNKLNTSPLSVTNFTAASSQLQNNTEVYVTTIVNEQESAPSSTFKVKTTGFLNYRSAFLDITYGVTNDKLDPSYYNTKFVWPVDLDGDGEYDFIVDRVSNSSIVTHKIQAYLRDGTCLWTVDMGPNVNISQGHNDMVIAYDMDCDGKGEVIIKSSDGTRFWDPVNKTWGKYLLGSSNGDTDGDGIIDYTKQSVKNPPQYITVINGLTGEEMNTIEMPYPTDTDGHQYTRNNKANYMGDDYNNLNGHMGIAYLDGVHPSVVMEYMCRRASDQYHYYYATAWGYKFVNGVATDWEQKYTWNRGREPFAEFHHIRVADVDFDGRDEMLDGGFGLKYDGTPAFNANISHGDRFRVSDIDPDRPGLETFAIQQNASDMLGMILYESGTGEPIKKWYLPANGDVGRGECMDIDSLHPGYEVYSTMGNIYNAQGDVIYEGDAPFAHEGMWWDGDLLREELSATDGDGANADMRKYSVTSHSFDSRLIEFARITDWATQSEYGVRPGFFGDIIGDWREEVILKKMVAVSGSDTRVCKGIVGFSTDYPTDHRLYCLMQNPAYRMQATTKGYYQSPFPDYYLGHGMLTPPVPAAQKADIRWNTGTSFDKVSTNFVSFDQKENKPFVDGNEVMFDISGDDSKTIQLNTNVAPGKVWAMPPIDKHYIIEGTGAFTGSMDLVKSMYGTFQLNGNHTYTGKTIISEGNLCVNGSLTSVVDLRAKGTLSGNAILNGGVILNPGLNVEGGKLAPGNGLATGKLGKITIKGNTVMSGKSNIEIDIIPEDADKNDFIQINGDFAADGENTIILRALDNSLVPGRYTLIEWTGNFTGSVDNFKLTGISGIPMILIIEDNSLVLVVKEARSTSQITWTGSSDGNWDYQTNNFRMLASPQEETYFVKNDEVVFNDEASRTEIELESLMIVDKISFENNTLDYSLTGTGGIAGTSDLVKTGKGLLDLNNIQSTYTGKNIYTDALVKMSLLNRVNLPGALGMSSPEPENWIMKDSRLIVNSISTDTDRGIYIEGSDTIEIPKSRGVVTISGQLKGTGNFVKTGPGQLNFSGSVANTYSGETVISGGTIGLGSLVMNTYGFGTNRSIRMENGGAIVMYYNQNDYNQKPTWDITIPEGHTASLTSSGRCNINGSLSGGGTLNYITPYVRADIVAGGADFTGKIVVTTTRKESDGTGDFRITSNSVSFPNAEISLGNNVYMGAYASVGASSVSTSTQVKIGSLSGESGSKVGGGKWLIGSDNRDATFRGTFTDGATVTKSGTGKWTLTNASTCTATFTVSGGTLCVQNTTGSATGTGTLSISNAKLIGTGSIGSSVNASTNAVVMPANQETSIGKLTFAKNLTLVPSATIIMKVNATSNDVLNVGGTLTLNGILDLRNLSGNWVAGKSYKLFTASTIIVGDASTFSIIPEIPGEGLIWDRSQLKEGIIAIKPGTSINKINAETVDVYPRVVEDFCYVSLGAITGDVQLELFNQIGGKELNRLANGDEDLVELNLSSVKSGVYFLRLTNSKSSFVYKLIKK